MHHRHWRVNERELQVPQGSVVVVFETPTKRDAGRPLARTQLISNDRVADDRGRVENLVGGLGVVPMCGGGVLMPQAEADASIVCIWGLEET